MPTSLDPSQEDLLSNVMLVAENDGDAYRDNKNATRAVTSAFHDLRRSQMEQIAEDFKHVRPLLEKYLGASWKGKSASVDFGGLDADQLELSTALLNMASNDGDAYRDNKNYKRAISTALADYKRNVDTMLREDFYVVRPIATKQLTKRWRSRNPCGCMHNPATSQGVSLSETVGPFRIDAVPADGRWYWRMFLGDEYLDGGPEAIGVDSYAQPDEAIDMGTYLAEKTEEAELLKRGYKQSPPFRAHDSKTGSSVSWGPGKSIAKMKHGAIVDDDTVRIYERTGPNEWKLSEVDDLDPIMSRRLQLTLAQERVDKGTASWSGKITDADVAEVFEEYMAAEGPDPKEVEEALKVVNRHRRKIGMAPLDPRSAGWTADDVLIEARRIGRSSNPRLQRERKAAVRQARRSNPEIAANGRRGPGQHGHPRT